MGAGCAVAPRQDSPARAPEVRVAGLDLEVYGPGQARLLVRAEAAELDDLPGRGAGRLRAVAASASVGPGAEVRIEAPEGELTPGGGVRLRDARLERSGPAGVRMRAGSVELSPTGELVATEVSARWEVSP